MAVFGAVLLAIAASVIATNQEVERLNSQLAVAIRMERDASELSYLWNDYLLYRESQLRARWESKFAAFSDDVGSLVLGAPNQRAVLDNIKASQRRLEKVFVDVASTIEGTSSPREGVVAQAFVEDSWSRMAVQNQAVFFDASRLSQMLREQADSARQTNILLIFGLLAMLGAYFFSNYLLIYRRILQSLGELRLGTKIIGAGELRFAIPVRHDDEVGELSRAFNVMAASLRTVTASKVELEREIGERKRAEDTANRQKAIQEGINRILEAALTCDTEEELGRAALVVAEEVTESKFGFIGEINAEGRLDDIAISDPGWDACRMEQPIGHRTVPSSFKVHGIYGRVLLDGKGLYTNDPASHPDSIGTPEGHPPLRAFLGVPLTYAGKTIGVVAVGNREGGYREEDLAALDSLAPAVVQVFIHKRAENERERLLAELDATLGSVADGLIIYGPTGDVLSINSAALDILGCSPDEKGKPLLEQVEAARVETPDGKPLPVEELPAARALRGEVLQAAILVVRRPQGTRWIAASTGPIRGSEGQILGAVVNFADVTALQLLQEQQQEFVSLVSHDLRNPLTSLMGTAELLQRGLGKGDTRRQARLAQTIVRSAKRMEAMIRDLADSAQLEAGSLELRKEPTDPRQMIVDLVERVGRPEETARISVEATGCLPPVLVDVQRLERAFTNVLTNALKYSPPDKPVEVRVAQRDGKAIITVSDQGVGIPPEDLPYIFERNFRAKTAGKQEGLGLGLYITRLIVEAHGGTVGVESKVGQGTTFCICLPKA